MIVAILAAYVAIGFVFVFLGPAAGSLRQETVSVSMLGAPAWKILAFRATLSAGVVFFWPLLVPSAWKEQRLSRTFGDREMQNKPSSKATTMIAEIKANPPRTITLEEYHSLGQGLERGDGWFIRQAMEKRGYLVAMATTERGDVMPASFRVAAEIGQSIVLTETSPGAWTFDTSADSWKHLAGRAGDADIEDGVVVSVSVTVMN